MLKYLAVVIACIGSAGATATYFERALSQERTRSAHALVSQRVTFMNAMQKMRPLSEIDEAKRALRDGASTAQSAILDAYAKVYCADLSRASAQEKQEAMDMAATLSGIAVRAGIGDVALAEYAKCKH